MNNDNNANSNNKTDTKNLPSINNSINSKNKDLTPCTSGLASKYIN